MKCRAAKNRERSEAGSGRGGSPRCPDDRDVARDLEAMPAPRSAGNPSEYALRFRMVEEAPVLTAWKSRGSRPAAFCRTNFVLDARNLSDGIKHGTARGESTPRVRAGSTFSITRTTRRLLMSKRAKPRRLLPPSVSEPSWLGLPREGHRFREDQGGPQ